LKIAREFDIDLYPTASELQSSLMRRPLLLGHRGVRIGGGPAENTLDAFDAALEAGCDGFEFDVRLSFDGVPVICHDAQHAGLPVAKTRIEVLNLPTLDQILAKYSRRAFLDIELKVAGIEEKTLDLISRHAFPRGFVVSSFLPAVLRDLRARNSEIPLGFICDRADMLPLWRELPCSRVIPHYSLVNPQLVTEIQREGTQVDTWTVNDSGQMLLYAGWGVDGIISDDPRLLVRTLSGK
jgi:glycerophosphoryl diester phosphodiesterase